MFNELVTFRIKEYKNKIPKTYENVIDMFKDMTICLVIPVNVQIMYNTEYIHVICNWHYFKQHIF